MTDAKFADCIGAEAKYAPAPQSLIGEQAEQEVRIEMIKNAIIKEAIMPQIDDTFIKTAMEAALNKLPNLTFVFLEPFLAVPSCAAELNQISLAEYSSLTELITQIEPDKKFKVKGVPQAKMDSVAERAQLKTDMLDKCINSNESVDTWKDAIENKIKNSVGVSE